MPVKLVYGGGALFPGQPFGTPAELNQLIDMLLENGIETIDTAQTYGNGTSEVLLGETGAVHRMIVDTKHCGGWIPGQSSTEAVISRGRESLKKLKANNVASNNFDCVRTNAYPCSGSYILYPRPRSLNSDSRHSQGY